MSAKNIVSLIKQYNKKPTNSKMAVEENKLDYTIYYINFLTGFLVAGITTTPYYKAIQTKNYRIMSYLYKRYFEKHGTTYNIMVVLQTATFYNYNSKYYKKYLLPYIKYLISKKQPTEIINWEEIKKPIKLRNKNLIHHINKLM